MRAILLLFFLNFYLSVSAQEVISNAGEHIESAAGSASWTMGEPICQTLEGSGEAGFVTQGFHQPLALAPIPTMGQWGIILCGLVLMIIGIIAIRQSGREYAVTYKNKL